MSEGSECVLVRLCVIVNKVRCMDGGGVERGEVR